MNKQQKKEEANVYILKQLKEIVNIEEMNPNFSHQSEFFVMRWSYR